MNSSTAWHALMIVAAVAAVTGAALLALRRRGAGWTVGVAAVALGFGALAARGVAAQRAPIQNLFEAAVTLGVFAGAIGVFLGVFHRHTRPLAAGLGAMGLALGAGLLAPIPGRPIEPEAPILNAGMLLVMHVGAVLFGYACIAVGFGGSAAFLTARAKGKPAGGFDRLQSLCANLAFITLGAGILLGAVWADRAWGRWWAFDPKETWALITWGVYLASIHLRFVLPSRRRGVVTAWMSVGGFALMLWSLLGVNLLMPGLHSYA